MTVEKRKRKHIAEPICNYCRRNNIFNPKMLMQNSLMGPKCKSVTAENQYKVAESNYEGEWMEL